MANFEGKYQLESSENFDEFLKALGECEPTVGEGNLPPDRRQLHDPPVRKDFHADHRGAQGG